MKRKIAVSAIISVFALLLVSYLISLFIFWDTSEYYHPTETELQTIKGDYTVEEESLEEQVIAKCDSWILGCEQTLKLKPNPIWSKVELVKIRQVKRDFSRGLIDGETALFALEQIQKADFELSNLFPLFMFPGNLFILLTLIIIPTALILLIHFYNKKHVIAAPVPDIEE